jgi:hypothetical protein
LDEPAPRLFYLAGSQVMCHEAGEKPSPVYSARPVDWIAYSKNTLYMLNSAAGEVLSLKVEAHGLAGGNPAVLHVPVGVRSVAVSPSGKVALLSPGANQVYLPTPNENDNIPVLNLDHIVLSRMFFDDNDLIFVDAVSKAVYRISTEVRDARVGREMQQSPVAPSSPAVRTILKAPPDLAGNILDVAFLRGVIYWAGTKGVSCYSISDARAVPVDTRTPEGLAVSERRVAYHFPQSSTVVLTSLPVPVRITLAGSLAQIPDAVDDLWRALAERDEGSVRSVKTGSTLAPDGLRTGIWQTLFAPAQVSGQLGRTKYSDDEVSMRAICRLSGLDAKICGGRDVASALAKAVTSGTPLRLPLLVAERKWWWSVNTDADATLETALNNAGVEPELYPVFEKDLVSAFAGTGTFSRELRESDVLPRWQGKTPIDVGSVVRLDENRRSILDNRGQLSKCRQPTASSSPASVPALPQAPRDSDLPFRVAASSVEPEFEDVFRPVAYNIGMDRIAELQVTLGQTTRRALGGHATTAAWLIGADRKCLDQLIGPDTRDVYVVSEVLEAPKAKVQGVTKTKIDASGVETETNNIRLDSPTSFTYSPNQPLVLGYRVSPISELSFAAGEWSRTPIGLPEPLKFTDLLKRRAERSGVPRVQWQFYAAVYLRDLDLDQASALQTVRKRYAATQKERAVLSIYSMQALAIRPAIFSTAPAAPRTPPPYEAAINYPREGLAAKNSEQAIHKVAIVEQMETINRNHEVFKAAGRSRWETDIQQDDKQHQGCRDSCNGNTSCMEKCDHGTMVAGLIAQLDSNARFIPIPLSSDASLSTLQSELNDRLTSSKSGMVVNVSQQFDKKDNTDDVRASISGSWNKHLFITSSGAAGDPGRQIGKDLSDDSNKDARVPLVNFLADPTMQLNVLAVAASSNDRKLATRDGSGPPMSNFGRPYVQLLAPGLNISVPAYDGGETNASGSSFAAPMVSAAAAILLTNWKPSIVKARLIYTADWVIESERKNLWGGHLNFARAVEYPNVTILSYPGDSDVQRGIHVENDDEFIDLSPGDPELNNPKLPPFEVPQRVRIGDILRLTRNHFRFRDVSEQRSVDKVVFTDSFNLIYLDRNTPSVRIIRNVTLAGGSLRYTERWAKDGKETRKDVPAAEARERTREFNEIFDYVAEIGRLPTIVGVQF